MGGEKPPHNLADDGDRSSPVIKAFLIADVRGYTHFTQQRGDEAAGVLAAKFAEIARAAVMAAGGTVIELRGDEALAVFDSPRQAIRASVGLQASFVDATEDDPSLPLRVGIGLDAGEAVPVEEGFRGGALNLAARLCSLAGPGEILASQEIVHLAQRLEGIRYIERGAIRLKGMASPVRPVKVLPETGDPAERLRRIPAPPTPPRGRRTVIAMAVAVVLLAAALPIGLTFSHHHGSTANSTPTAPGFESRVARIDSVTSALRTFSVEGHASAVAAGGGFVWVALKDRNEVTQLDARRPTILRAIRVGDDPVALAFGDDSLGPALWVSSAGAGTVSRIDPSSGKVVETIAVGDGVGDLVVGAGAVWAVNRARETVSRIDPATKTVTASVLVPHVVSIASESGSVWVLTEFTRLERLAKNVYCPDCTLATVREVNATGDAAGPAHPVFDTQGGPTSSIALSGGTVWVPEIASEIGFDGVVEFDPRTEKLKQVSAGTNPRIVIGGLGSDVWVAAGTDLWKLSPSSGGVVDSVPLPGAATSLGVGEGAIWAVMG